MLRIVRPASLFGEIRPPSDKSLTHRAFMFGAIASEPSVVRDPLRGEDCLSTLRCLEAMGLRAEWLGENEVRLVPALEWTPPGGPLDCGNSGTTMRLLSGLIASRPLDVVMSGDPSLSRRPMKRIAEPLRLMGATIEGDTPPLHVVGRDDLTGIDYVSPVASAQVKSCVLLAGLRATGPSSVTEPALSRDHTERMLAAMGAELDRAGLQVSISPSRKLAGFNFSVPADISSAAFWMVAAAIVPGAQITLCDVNTNPTRTGILDVFAQAGIPVVVDHERTSLGEPLADLEVRAMDVGMPFAIDGDLVPRLIDEIPVLAVLATQLDGISRIRGARELRVKESDRIETVATALRAMGAKVETYDDGMDIEGPTPLHGATIEANHDHRIAMAFAIAGLIADGETRIEGSETIATSYPEFETHLSRLAVW